MSFFTISSTIQSDNELRDIAWEYHNQLTAPSSQSCHQIVIACSLAPWLEKAMAPQSSTLVWKIPWMEEPGRLQSMRSRRVGHDWATSLSLSCIGEGNGNPLQCSCLESPSDGGSLVGCHLWAAVMQSQTRLKWLSSSSSLWRNPGHGMQAFSSPLFPPLSIYKKKVGIKANILTPYSKIFYSP